MRGKIKYILILVVSALLIAGTSFALKMLERKSASDESGYDGVSAVYASLNKQPSYARPSGGCNSSGGGCNSSRSGRSSCCGGGSGGGAPLNQDAIKAGVLKYYAENYGDVDVTCEVKDYGCHMEAEILKNGVVVKKFSISGNNITEIS